MEGCPWGRLDRPLVQISVGVAAIPVPRKTEVEKGSAATALGRGLLGPKGRPNSRERESAAPKGQPVNTPAAPLVQAGGDAVQRWRRGRAWRQEFPCLANALRPLESPRAEKEVLGRKSASASDHARTPLKSQPTGPGGTVPTTAAGLQGAQPLVGEGTRLREVGKLAP